MRVGLLAEKVGMTRFYDKDKINHSVTVLQVKDCKVVAIKNLNKDGYNAVRLSHGDYLKPTGKPFKEFLKKNNLKAFSSSKEFRVTEPSDFKIGDNINSSNFIVGQYVDVTSNSIGKGFAGGMKRHNFAGNRATHGVSISHRSHGSTGQCQDPGKVFKGKKMAGRLGNKKVTVQNLKVLSIDTENNLIVVKGAVPGHKGSVIRIVDSVKKKQDIKPNSNSQNIQNQVLSNTSPKDNESKPVNNLENQSPKIPSSEDVEVTEIKTKTNELSSDQVNNQETNKTSNTVEESKQK